MADVRVQQPVKIVDPTTDANQMGVDASGLAQVDIAANSAGNITVDIAATAGLDTNAGVDGVNTLRVTEATDSNLTVAAELIDDAIGTDDTTTHATGTTKGVMVMAAATPTDSAVAANDMGHVAMSLDRRLHTDTDIVANGIGLMLGSDFTSVLGTVNLTTTAVLADAVATSQDVLNVRNFNYIYNGTTFDFMREGGEAGSLLVDLGANNDVTTDVDTTLSGVIGTDGSAGPASVPSIGGTESGGNIQECLVDADGHLQIDVLTGGGSDTPTNPTSDDVTSAALAAGSSVDLNSAEIAEAEKLWGVDISSSVAWKGIVRMVENGADNTTSGPVILFGRAGETVQWRAPHRDFMTHAGTSAGLDVFQVDFTNMDTSEAADAYCTFWYST